MDTDRKQIQLQLQSHREHRYDKKAQSTLVSAGYTIIDKSHVDMKAYYK